MKVESSSLSNKIKKARWFGYLPIPNAPEKGNGVLIDAKARRNCKSALTEIGC
jgi:hypothetical protein